MSVRGGASGHALLPRPCRDGRLKKPWLPCVPCKQLLRQTSQQQSNSAPATSPCTPTASCAAAAAGHPAWGACPAAGHAGCRSRPAAWRQVWHGARAACWVHRHHGHSAPSVHRMPQTSTTHGWPDKAAHPLHAALKPTHLLHARHGRQRLAALPLVGFHAAAPAALPHHAPVAAHARRAGHGACNDQEWWQGRERVSEGRVMQLWVRCHMAARPTGSAAEAALSSRPNQQRAPAGMRPLCHRSSAPKAPGGPPRGPRPPGGGMGGMFSRDSCLNVSASMPLGGAARPGGGCIEAVGEGRRGLWQSGARAAS